MQLSPKSGPKRPYHHGNLVETLISATVRIVEERGPEHVSVREVAKIAGVSPAAPFRHFPTKVALMTAVAEQAMTRLTEAVRAGLETVSNDDPLAGIEAIGQAYLVWAVKNPTHFQIISSRDLIDFHASEKLRSENEAIRLVMRDLFAEAARKRLIPDASDLEILSLSARAFVYGLARMFIDGHFPEWHETEQPEISMRKSLSAYIRQISAREGS